MKREWFRDWFNSPYYHILYKNRDKEEADSFIDQLSNYLSLKEGNSVLDIGCGQGRHSLHLFKKGYKVTGVDLSFKSIKYGNQYANELLKFYVADMRNLQLNEKFNCILNLFTSFGFFDYEEENLQTLFSFKRSLKDDGRIVLDYLNSAKVIRTLIEKEEKQVEGILFKIHRTQKDNFIIKNISFSDKGNDYYFTEKVKAITYEEFINYFKFTGLKIKDIFGNYALEEFNEEKSDRIIFILEKE